MTSPRQFALVLGVSLIFALVGLAGILWALARDDGDAVHGTAQPPGDMNGTGQPLGDAGSQFGSFFIDGSGRFVAPVLDDRALSDEQKEADPVINPAWAPFSTCLAQGGLEVRDDPGRAFTQRDLDAVLARVNEDFPDRDANRTIVERGYPTVGGTAGTYLRCAYEWLLKSPREIYELTGRTSGTHPSEHLNLRQTLKKRFEPKTYQQVNETRGPGLWRVYC